MDETEFEIHLLRSEIRRLEGRVAELENQGAESRSVTFYANPARRDPPWWHGNPELIEGLAYGLVIVIAWFAYVWFFPFRRFRKSKPTRVGPASTPGLSRGSG